jgi:autotransporter strand-loop-strand O-heptosyltransferase
MSDLLETRPEQHTAAVSDKDVAPEATVATEAPPPKAPQEVMSSALAKAAASVREPESVADSTAVGDAAPDESRSAPVKEMTNAPPMFVEATAVPTRKDVYGICYDFNSGVRVTVPAGAEGAWMAEFRDVENDHVLFRHEIKPGTVWASKKRYYIPWELKVWKDGNVVFSHRMDLKGKKVLVQFPGGLGTLGDFLGWLPYVDKFQTQQNCELTATLPQHFIDLVAPEYPNLKMVTQDRINPADYYATYKLGLFFNDTECTHQPADFRYVGLHRTAGHILGVDPTEMPPRLHIPDLDVRPIAEKYVVIATKASTQCKYWNHLHGWREIIKFLMEAGYRVICIDKEAVHGNGRVFNHLPHGCEDETGNRPLAERARWIRHADFFIGLSSGLSWLAWAVGQRNIVMISGFTHPNNEFHTPYRVINFNTCNSCWNDPAHNFDHKDFLWCPRQSGTDREFECTKQISPERVKAVIRTIPQFMGQ